MATIEDRVAALETQVAALAAQLERPVPAGAAAPTGTALWALEELRRRLPEGGSGAVLYTGVVEARPGERYEWQYGLPTEQVLGDEDWSAVAGALAALAHPVRLLLLCEILGGRRAASELAEAEGLGTSGQLYHHLRQLVNAGWLRSTTRGSYTIPPERVVPLLVTLAAARR